MTHQISITEAQAKLLKELLAPSLEYTEDGELDTSINPLAANIAKQLEIQDHVGYPNLWFTLYSAEQVYGGPEEGGWYYTHVTPLWSMSTSDPSELSGWWNEQINDLADAAYSKNVKEEWLQSTISESFVIELANNTHNDSQQSGVCSPVLHMCSLFTDTAGLQYWLVIESVRGSQTTTRRATYC